MNRNRARLRDAARGIGLLHVAVFLLACAVGLNAASAFRPVPQAPAPQVTVAVPPSQVHVANAYPALPVNASPDRLPQQYREQHWTRVDAPPGYPTVVRACLGADGLYDTQFGAVAVVPRDPECAAADPPPAKKLAGPRLPPV